MGVFLILFIESVWEFTVFVKCFVLIFIDEGLVDLLMVGVVEYVLFSYVVNGVGKCWKLRCLILKLYFIMDVWVLILGWI